MSNQVRPLERALAISNSMNIIFPTESLYLFTTEACPLSTQAGNTFCQQRQYAKCREGDAVVPRTVRHPFHPRGPGPVGVQQQLRKYFTLVAWYSNIWNDKENI